MIVDQNVLGRRCQSLDDALGVIVLGLFADWCCRLDDVEQEGEGAVRQGGRLIVLLVLWVRGDNR